MAQEVRYGFMGKVDVAILEACEITPDGKVYLLSLIHISPPGYVSALSNEHRYSKLRQYHGPMHGYKLSLIHIFIDNLPKQ